MKRILALALALMLLLAAPALAAASALKPTDDFYVNDAAGVLSNETIGHIVLNNDALYNACGAQIVFVTVDTTGSAKLENYAYNLFNQWKIGGSKNYGFLVVMAIRDDDYWYEIGSGLDQYLTAGDAGELMDEYLEPYFARQDYDGGAKALFDALFSAVSRALKANVSIDNTAYSRYVAKENATNTARTTTGTTARTTPQRASDSEDGFGFLGLILIVVIIVVIVLIVKSRKRRKVVYSNQNPTVIINNPTPTSSAQSYNRGFLAGMLTGSSRRRTPPPPAQPYNQPYTQVPPAGRTNTAQRPVTQSRPTTAQRPTQTPPTQSYGGFTQPPGRASSAGRTGSASRSSGSSSTSIGSTLNSLFGSGAGRSSSGFGRSSSSSRSSGRTGGFGGGRSGGGGSTRGSGGGRHR